MSGVLMFLPQVTTRTCSARVQKMASLIDAGITLDPDDYDRSTQRYLYWKSDADNDGYNNLEEWQAVSPTGELEYATAFAFESTNGEPPPGPGGPSPSPPGPGACAYCDDDECGKKTTASVDVMEDILHGGVKGGEATADTAETGLDLGPEPQEVLLGEEVSVLARPYTSPDDPVHPFHFLAWHAPETMLHNSRAMEGTLLLATASNIYARFGQRILDLPDDGPIYTVNVTTSDLVLDTAGADGKRELHGSKNTKVTLSLTINDPDYFHNGWEHLASRQSADPRYSWTKKVSIRMGEDFIHPMVTMGAVEFARKTISMGSNMGGKVLGATAHAWKGVYNYSVTFCPGTPLSFTAIAEDGFEFVQWEGSGDTNPYLVYVDGDDIDHVQAIFERKAEYTVDLEVKKVGSPPGGNCAGWIEVNDPKRYYPRGADVRFTAKPNPGFAFAGWDGDGGPYYENPFRIESIKKNWKLTARFEPIELKIQSLSFAADHNDLYLPLFGTFEAVGARVPKPEWVRGRTASYPAKYTMSRPGDEKRIWALVTLAVVNKHVGSPSDYNLAPFKLEGDGSKPCLDLANDSFRKTLTRTVIGKSVTPDTLEIIKNATINWTATFKCGEEWEVDADQSGPHRIYITYGENTCTSSVLDGCDSHNDDGFGQFSPATLRRMEFILAAAIAGGDTKEKRWAASGVSQEISDSLNNWSWPAGPLWGALDDGTMECESARYLGVISMMMLGVPQGDLRWKMAQGCQAYTSTDNKTGSEPGFGYLTDCTAPEYPSAWCSPGCNTPDEQPHPAHGCVGTEDGEYDGWQLCIEDNGPMENFFKIKEFKIDPEDDEEEDRWYYLSVTPKAGPFLGSLQEGTEADKSARYKIINGLTKTQKWRRKWGNDTWLVEAPDRP